MHYLPFPVTWALRARAALVPGFEASRYDSFEEGHTE